MSSKIRTEPKRVRRDLGFTLMEAIVAMGVFMMITLLSLNLLKMASGASARIVSGAELLENARIGMDVILAHVREAESIKLTTDTNSATLRELIARVKKGNTYHDYRFTYNQRLVLGEARYHRLDFGNNELASHISDIQMTIEDEILYITIVTDANIGADAVTLRASCDLRYKEIQ